MAICEKRVYTNNFEEVTKVEVSNGTHFDIPQGGYMAAKIAKLEKQYESSTSNINDNSQGIFRGIAIFVNGYTGM